MTATLSSLLSLAVGFASLISPATAATTPADLPTRGAGAEYPTWGQGPVGANDWDCRPIRERPRPAVIVHGTFGDQKTLLDPLSYALKEDGYCVYALDYGNRGTVPIQRSARQLDRFVDRVLASTGSDRVSIVGHSQGGMMPRWYIKNLGGKRLVEDLVGLAPSNHGTTVNQNLDSSETCRSCEQQRAGSRFLRRLNHPDETPGDVDYTQVVTENDEVVVPYTSGFLEGRRSTNITLQDRCPVGVEHNTIPMDRQAIAWVLHAFDRDGPASPKADITCT